MEGLGYKKFVVPGEQISGDVRFKREIKLGLEIRHWIQGPPTERGYYVVSVTEPWTIPHQDYVMLSGLEQYIKMFETNAQEANTRQP